MDAIGPHERATFSIMDDSTARDWAIFDSHHRRMAGGIADQLLEMMSDVGKKTYAGLPISHLGHGLQSATFAQADGMSEEYIVMSLFHDIGYLVSPVNHAEASAAILRPYLSPRLYWILRHHTIFEGYHYWDVIGGDRHTRELWRGHKWFRDCAHFVDAYDQRAFDRTAQTLPMQAFEPMVRRVLEKPRADYSNEPPATLFGRVFRRSKVLALKGLERVRKALD